MVSHSTTWSADAEARYQALLADQGRKGCHGLALLAITLFPAFAYLDYFAHREHLQELWTLRFSTVFIYLLIYAAILSGHLLRRPYPTMLAMAAIASISITAMCLVLGGYVSPYYAGVNLVVLALVLVMPVGARRMAAGVTMVIGIYLLGILVQSRFRISQPEALLNNLYFLLATGVIGVTAAYLTDRLRRESFARYLELERAQADLKQSRDMLQMELKSEQGNVELLVREITERKAELERALTMAQSARDEAQRALQLREEFISLASHELRTPLTSLKLQTQMAQRKLDQPEGLETSAVARLIRTYDAQLERLIRIIGDMLDISRIRSGKLDLERSPLELGELVRGVVERTLESGERRAEVSLSAPEPVRGHWDPFRIEQVVLNLLTNALKYGEGKPVDIRVTTRNGSAVVSIRDRGIGIPPDSHQRIFERFERAVAPRSFAGLGLGLYICRQIVEAHGGKISVESAPGEGSVFTVTLPLNPSETAPD